MIDFHCHILPAIDDGAASWVESLEMARFCAADGIRQVFATPHCHKYVHNLRTTIVPLVAELNARIAAAGIHVEILSGSEIQVIDSYDYKREFESGAFCHFNGGCEFTLLEFNWAREQFPADAVALVAWLRSRGTTPILAHPERHGYFDREPGLLRGLVDAGAWVQVTVDSILGNHGPDPKVAAERILRDCPEAILSTDAHNLVRCSGLAAGYAWVREHLGAERRDDLLARAESALKRIRAPFKSV